MIPSGDDKPRGHGGTPGLARASDGTPALRGAQPIERLAPGNPPPPALSATPDALSLLMALKRRWALALGIGVLCAGLAVAVTWRVLPASKYTARAMLTVSSNRPHIIFKTGEDNIDYETYKHSQLVMIKSRLVLGEVLRDPKVKGLEQVRTQNDPIAWLGREIQASHNGEILSISMSGDRPNDLAVLVNAVTEVYQRRVVDVETGERRNRYSELKEIYRDYQEKLQERRKQLKQLAEMVGSSDPETVRLTHEFALLRRYQAQKETMDLEAEIRRAETELEIRKSQTKASEVTGAAVPDAMVREQVENDPEVIRLRGSLAAHQARYADVSRITRDKADPALQRTYREYVSAGQTLAARRADLRSRASQMLQQQARSVASPSATQDRVMIGGSTVREIPFEYSSPEVLRERVVILKELKKKTDAILEILTKDTRQIQQSSADLESIRDEIAHADSAAKKVGEEVESLNVELRAPARIRLLELADAPRVESDKRMRMAGLAGLGAFGVVLLGVSWNEYRARRLGSVDEVVHGLGMRLVGALPVLPMRRRGLTGSAASREDRWNSILVESVDSIRTVLLHDSRVESLRAVMVCSAVGGEGKTSLSCHLASSLARAGRRTLLVDGDLRKPSLNRLFDLPLGPGFCEVLRGEAGLDDVIQPTPASGLWMIAAGRCDSRAIQGLAREDLRIIFDRLKERYDFVVVDSSPVLPVTDALLIGQHVDAAICSVLRDVSRIPQIHAANERLLTLGIRIFGVVMSGVRGHAYEADYNEPLEIRG